MLPAMTKALVASGFATVVVMLACRPVSAQDLLSAPLIKQGDETLWIDLGGIVNQFGTTLKLNGQFQNGTNLDLERNGLKKTQSSFQATASLRFLSRNRVDLQYFSASRTGSKTYQEQITIGDNVYPLGATVSANAENEFLIGDYRYSFVKSDSVELAGLIGIYGGQFKFDVTATGNAGNAAAATSKNASTYVPVPLIGGSVDWYVDPRWRIGGIISGLKAHIGGVDGKSYRRDGSDRLHPLPQFRCRAAVHVFQSFGRCDEEPLRWHREMANG